MLRRMVAGLADLAWRLAVEFASLRYGWAYPALHTWMCLLLGMTYRCDGYVIRWSSGATMRLRLSSRIALALWQWGAPAIRRRWAAEHQAQRAAQAGLSSAPALQAGLPTDRGV